MATYRIAFLNGGSDIADPVITVDNKLRGLNPDAMTVDVTVYFSITSNGKESKFGLMLNDVSVNNLTYNYVQLTSRVMTKLEEFLIP